MRTTFIYLMIMGAVGVGTVNPKVSLSPHCDVMYAAGGGQLEGPGNPGHKEPPPGESCVHNANDPAHNCACHRECKPDTDDEGNPTNPPSMHVQEDAQCRVYCYKDHCHCPIHNCD